MNEKQIEGRFGEMIATRYLKDLGYKIICNNFRCVQGEIDIVAKDNEEFVFIEVKTRKDKNYGEAREAVTARKQKHIKNAIQYYLYKNNIENAFIRIDVIEVYLQNGTARIKYVKHEI